MSINCNYHPGIPAAHTCPKCKANFCSTCIIKRKSDYYGMTKDVFLCPRCNVYTEKLSFTHSIKPFWKRFPQIFRYPLKLQPMILIVILSLIQSLFMSIFFFGAIIQFICFGIILTYANIVLEDSSQGNLKTPAFDLMAINENFTIVYKQIGIYIVLFAAPYTVYKIVYPILGPQISTVAFSLLITASFFLLPAMLIMLAVTKSFFAAILPNVFIRLAWRIGWPYLALCFFLLILLSAPVMIVGFTEKILPDSIRYILGTALSYYYMIVSYHLMGYILFQYHEQVGYEVIYNGEEETPEEKPRPRPDRKNAGTSEPLNNELLSRLNILVKDGEHDAAIKLIQEETKGFPTDLLVAERYFNLLRIKQRREELTAFGNHYIRLLIKGNDKRKICEVYLECAAIHEDFFNGDANTLFVMAKALNQMKHFSEAFKLFQKFIGMYPDDPMAPNAYFFLAMLYNEQFSDPDKASEILRYLKEKYPFHENSSFVDNYSRKVPA
jgi:tetratricopeptide (TPR) repeat protein